MITDLQRVTGVPCRPLNTIPVHEDADIVPYYENTGLMESFPDSEPINQSKSYKITIDSMEFKVMIEAETCIDEVCEKQHSILHSLTTTLSLGTIPVGACLVYRYAEGQWSSLYY